MSTDDATLDRAREAVQAMMEAPDLDAAAGQLMILLGNAAEAARRGIGGNAPPETIDGDDPATPRLDPEHLLVCEVADLAGLLAEQYPELVRRAHEFQQALAAWRTEHGPGKRGIADDAEFDSLSDWMRQLRDFAGDDGEVHNTRKRVKRQPWEATKAIDAWFGALADPITGTLGNGRNAPAGTLQHAQTEYLLAKAERVKAEAERRRREAEAEAQEKAKIAREAQAEEQARIAQLAAAGVHSADAEEAVMNATDAAIGDAAHAAQVAASLTEAANAPLRDMVRSRSAVGTTTTLLTTWDVTAVDLAALCRAVADGTAPSTFVVADMVAIRQAVRRKIAPLRTCPGLTIAPIPSARRSGP